MRAQARICVQERRGPGAAVGVRALVDGITPMWQKWIFNLGRTSKYLRARSDVQSITLTSAVRDTREPCACPHCPASFDWGWGTRTSVVRRPTSELRLRFACACVVRSPCRCAVVCRRTTGVLCAMAFIALQCVDAFVPATPAGLQVACLRSSVCVRA